MTGQPLARTPSRGGRPSREAAGKLEARIVDTARVLFFAHGYGATSIETIARTAGISKRTFYHRFENKAAIFKAVVEGLIRKITPSDTSGLFVGTSLESTLLGLANAILKASLSPDTLALQRIVISEATRFPELGLVMDQQGARRDAISRIAELLTAKTEIRNASIAAEMFLNLVVGIPQRRAMGLGKAMDDDELSAWATHAVHLFLKGYEAI